MRVKHTPFVPLGSGGVFFVSAHPRGERQGVDSGFEQAHKAWLDYHLNARKGERLRRLESGHGYLEKEFLEKVWWPAFGTLDDLHPQYEVPDYNDGKKYLDQAYKPKSIRLGLEADGFFPHIRNIDRWDHADNVLRDLHLFADAWTMLHFSADVIKYRSRQAQQLLRQIVWAREGRGAWGAASLEAKELLRIVRKNDGTIGLKEAIELLGKSPNTVRKSFRELLDRKLLRPTMPGAKRIRGYEMTQAGRDIIL